ncbi:MAG: glycosyltransferase family 9 protein [Verrucomicrobiota bacterium]
MSQLIETSFSVTLPAAGRAAIVSDKQLGDVTLLEPMTRLLAAQTGMPCALHVKPAFRPLVELMSDAVWGPDVKGKLALSWTTSWSSRVVLQSWRLGARRRCLLVNQERHLRWWYQLLFHQVQVTSFRDEYWGHYFWRAPGGEEAAFISPRLNLPPDSWRHPSLPERPYILINPTAAWPNKYWLVEHWAAFLTAAGLPDLGWVMTGGGSPPEREHCAAISAQVPGSLGLVDLAGVTSLKEYLHAISRARLVICVDGSASHIAQAFGVPAITLFGPVYPLKWHWPTSKHRAVNAFDHVPKGTLPTSADLPLASVQSAVQALLADHPEIIAP